MVTNEFAEASAELIEILNYLPKSEVEKIPLKLRNFFKKVANPNYSVKIDPYKSLGQQNIKEKTKDLIAVIYRNYWCNKDERKTLDAKLIENDKKYEEILHELYNPDNIFKNKAKQEIHTTQTTEKLVEYKPQSFIQKLFTKIKSLFKRK